MALLRYVGCTGHAHEVATTFGDEIAIRAQTREVDMLDLAARGLTTKEIADRLFIAPKTA